MRERTTDRGLVSKVQIEPAPKAAKTVPLVPFLDPIAFFRASNLKTKHITYWLIFHATITALPFIIYVFHLLAKQPENRSGV